MFGVVSNYSEEEYYLKPMNCPNHCVLYKSKPRSYRDLPVRFSDFANLYRDEKPGELLGLARLRFFSQDDGHCFCTEEQLEVEFFNVAKVVEEALKPFGMKYWVRLSLWDPSHPEKYLGDKKTWEVSQQRLKDMLAKEHIEHTPVEGEAAIYGPKMDFIAIDSLKREWQISTIQLDLIMPKRFGLTYTDQDGQEKTPLMIHRAILGSPERLMGLLLEHYAGLFPVWLSPVQVGVIPVSDQVSAYAHKVHDSFISAGIRSELNCDNKTLGAKIRDFTLQKVPYLCIIGANEEKRAKQEGKAYVSIRTREGENRGLVALSDFLKELAKHIEKKA